MQEEMKKIPGNGFNRSRDSVCENRYAALRYVLSADCCRSGDRSFAI